jgi:predicted DNA-binding protein with PD1-like motif
VKIRQLDDAGGSRTFVLVCDRGDDPVEALTDAAKRYDLRAASLTGIGAFAGVTLGFFATTPGVTTAAGSFASRSRWYP